ncbi:MAG: DUF5785 family protein [Halodesulfurarchaeum sp.]
MAEQRGQDWPHDPDGEKGSEGMRNYDMAVISKMVDEDEDFPLDRETLLDEFGDWPVRINHQRVVSVADIFDNVEETTFETKQDLHRAVGNAMRDTDMWEYHPSE